MKQLQCNNHHNSKGPIHRQQTFESVNKNKLQLTKLEKLYLHISIVI
jgi:hypothetical protein